jgi:hypothetical protein
MDNNIKSIFDRVCGVVKQDSGIEIKARCRASNILVNSIPIFMRPDIPTTSYPNGKDISKMDHRTNEYEIIIKDDQKINYIYTGHYCDNEYKFMEKFLIGSKPLAKNSFGAYSFFEYCYKYEFFNMFNMNAASESNCFTKFLNTNIGKKFIMLGKNLTLSNGDQIQSLDELELQLDLMGF